MIAFGLGLAIGWAVSDIVLSPWLGPPLRRGVDWFAARLKKETANVEGGEKTD